MISQDKIALAEIAALIAKGATLTAAQESQLAKLLDTYPEARGILYNIISSERVEAPFNLNNINVEDEWTRFQSRSMPVEAREHKSRKIGRWLSIAASILLVCAIGTYLFLQRSKATYLIEDSVYGQKNDVLPGLNYAEVKLDGEGTYKINLDKNLQASRKDQDILLRKNKEVKANVRHTVTVPSRSYFMVSLSDGTKVWINSESQLEYLSNFSAKERRVKLTGEAYFEVAKDAHKPFIVETADMEVKAIGTAFSVNSFGGNEKVILAEGKVEVKANQDRVLLDAGQRAEMIGTKLKKKFDVSVDAALAVKGRYFSFYDKTLSEILSEAERWYGVEVQIDKPLHNQLFEGTVEKSATLAKFCEVLKELTGYHFEIDQKKLIVY